MEDWKQWRENGADKVACRTAKWRRGGGEWVAWLLDGPRPRVVLPQFYAMEVVWSGRSLVLHSLSSYASDVSVNARLTDRLSVGLNAYFGGRTALELGYLTC